MVKIILITFSATMMVVVLVATIFLNSILGIFGLVSTSVDSFNSLVEAKQTMSKVKKQHKVKKANLSKKFVKRTSKKITATAMGFVPGAGAVMAVSAVTALAVIEYCEDKEEINNEGNLLFGTDNSFDYTACMTEAKKDSLVMVESVKEDAPNVVSSAWELTKGISNEAWSSVVNSSSGAWAETSTQSKKIWELLIN